MAITGLILVFTLPIIRIASRFYKNLPHIIAKLLVPIEQSILKFGLWLVGIRTCVSGLENIQNLDSYIVMSNHNSYLDIIIIVCSLPSHINFVFKHNLLWIPCLNLILIASGKHVIINRRKKKNRNYAKFVTDKIVSTLQENACICIFPEGTRSKTNQLKPFKKGGFIASLQSQKPILPIAIHISKKGRKPLLAIHHRYANVKVKISKPIFPEKHLDTNILPKKEPTQRLIDKVKIVLENMLEELRFEKTTQDSGQ